MSVIEKIYSSNWWKEAMLYPNRHYLKDSGIMLSNHLLSVMENSIKIFFPESSSIYYKQLYHYLQETNFDLEKCKIILQIVSL